MYCYTPYHQLYTVSQYYLELYCCKPCHQLYTVSQYFLYIATNPDIINCIQSPNITYVLLQTLSSIVYSLSILLMYCYKPCHQLYTVSQYYLLIATNPVINCIQSPNITYVLLQTLSSIVYSPQYYLCIATNPIINCIQSPNITYVLLQTLSSIVYSPQYYLFIATNPFINCIQSSILLMYCYKPYHQLYTVSQYYLFIATNPVINCIQSPNITYVLLQTLSSIVYSLSILLI